MFIQKDIIPVICICISEILEKYVLVSIAMFSLEHFIIYLHSVVELIILIYIEFLYSNQTCYNVCSNQICYHLDV